jgi:hypothetical protein
MTDNWSPNVGFKKNKGRVTLAEGERPVKKENCIGGHLCIAKEIDREAYKCENVLAKR